MSNLVFWIIIYVLIMMFLSKLITVFVPKRQPIRRLPVDESYGVGPRRIMLDAMKKSERINIVIKKEGKKVYKKKVDKQVQEINKKFKELEEEISKLNKLDESTQNKIVGPVLL